MLTKLFNSQIIVKILGLFFVDEDKQYYTQEIIKKTGTDAANAQRGLVKLENLKILKSHKKGNHKYYSLNKENEYSPALKEMFRVHNQQNQGEMWFVLEEMPNYYPQSLVSGFTVRGANKLFASLGLEKKFSKLLLFYNNGMCTLMIIKKEFNALGQEMVNKLIADPTWGEQYIQLTRKKQQMFWQAMEKLLKINFGKLSDKQLCQLYSNYYDQYEDLHTLHWLQTCVDLGDSILSHYFLNYLRKKIKDKKYSLGDVFAVLTTPTEEGSPTKEYKNLIKILAYLTKNQKLKKYFKETETRLILDDLPRIDKKLDEQLQKHVQEYGWLGYGMAGPGWNKAYFIDILQSLIRQNAKVTALEKKIEIERQNLINKQKEYIKKFEIDQLHQKLFALAKDLVFTKGIRKDSMFFSYSVIENLFREIGKRHYLSVKQVRYLYPHELKQLLLSNKKISATTLNNRDKSGIYYTTDYYSNGTLLEGEKAKKFLKQFSIIKEDLRDIKVIQGDTATSGRVRGKVKIINVVDDMKNMQKGNILVSTATSPDLVPAIKQAAAIVTDVGGITSHAAIISRELGVPCVVGTKIATKVLKDGDLIDVDATHGKINIINKK